MSIDRHHVALPDQEAVARHDGVEGDFHERAVAQAGRGARHAGQERAHLAPGAPFGKAF